MENKLTFQAVQDAIDKLQVEAGCHKIDFIETNLLKGSQVVINTGSKIYYSPDLQSGEVKVIEVPNMFDAPLRVHFDDEPMKWSNPFNIYPQKGV